MHLPLVRRYTTEVGQWLTDQVIQMNGNENDPRGGGGTCFGDSGGPALPGGYVVGDTSYGYTNNCRYLGGLQRVDIPVVGTGCSTAWRIWFARLRHSLPDPHRETGRAPPDDELRHAAPHQRERW
ncbi:MAG TPA: trypsin-like serine protease [Actinomycetota bacterium]|nr:trypsin-like serine protease [Actinomycetota bacterium]